MDRTTMDSLGGEGIKRASPAAARNRAPIADVLAKELREIGTVLEIASGTGEHAVFLAARFPNLTWQPSDPDAGARSSIRAYRADYPGGNLREPVELDAARRDWPVDRADAILCVNMVHVSPWEATLGLFAGAERLLSKDAPLILYGPYLEAEVETAPSNLAFDESLKARDPRWGLRDIAAMDELAAAHGFARTARYAMPSNNIMLVYRSN